MIRASGILCPISSLASKYGIGCFSKEAYEFVNFLRDSGQAYWQVLPFGPTGYGDSPYQSFSTFAGNPYFIDLETLREEGLLTWDDLNGKDFGSNPAAVDYGAIYQSRNAALRAAYTRFNRDNEPDYEPFCAKNAYWLETYALFMALKEENGGASWDTWPEELKVRDTKAIKDAKERLGDAIGYQYFLQFEFDKQWKKLHKYANDNGVKIIGDIPFYTAYDSSDTWGEPEMYLFDKKNVPLAVAGCPPDAFSADGQLWGNPIYDWAYLKRHHYKWWVNRFRRCLELCDVLRVDHFRAFDEYYQIPYGSTTAKTGRWVEGPGTGLFHEVKKELGEVEIIAEDLGYITDSVIELVKSTGFPGMKVLEFAFDPREESDYLPHLYEHNCVVYTGTHDNETVRGWIENLDNDSRDFARRYINSLYTDYNAFTWDFIRTAYMSVADTCIIPLQDFLCKGNEARINHPSTTGTNWQWRLYPGELSWELSQAILNLVKLYRRISPYMLEHDPEEIARAKKREELKKKMAKKG